MGAKEKLIVALDLASADAAARLAERLRGHAGMFKVGPVIFTGEGPFLVRYLVAQGEKVFLDLKFHDIPNTVRAAAREAAASGVAMLNVHAAGGRKMMEAARKGAEEGARGDLRPLVLAVTVLTSLGREDLAEIGAGSGPEDQVVRLAKLAARAGLDGVVASPEEIAPIRRELGSAFEIVTPGIRPAGADANEQKRRATPAAAIQAGADYLVVGRPITEAPDPVAAADAIVREMEAALAPAAAGRVGQPRN
jgi:orotidine-5'-phosphate decarboxylase